jgi:hypothetical protein
VSGWKIGEETTKFEGRAVPNDVSSQWQVGLFNSPSISDIVQMIAACCTVSITIASSTGAVIAAAGATIPSALR